MSPGSCTWSSPLADAEDDELCGLNRCQANLNDDLTGVPYLYGVELFIALDIESLVRCSSEQSAISPNSGEESPDVSLDALP